LLGVEDLSDAVSSSAFFARKFYDPEVLDRLDLLLDSGATSEPELTSLLPLMPPPSDACASLGRAPARPRGAAP
jgi:hypothetical protein